MVRIFSSSYNSNCTPRYDFIYSWKFNLSNEDNISVILEGEIWYFNSFFNGIILIFYLTGIT